MRRVPVLAETPRYWKVAFRLMLVAGPVIVPTSSKSMKEPMDTGASLLRVTAVSPAPLASKAGSNMLLRFESL